MQTSTLSNDQIEKSRRDIPYLQDIVYVDNAAVSPVPSRVEKASNRYTELTVRNLREVTEIAIDEFDRGRALAAMLVGSSPSSIAYVQNTSHGLSQVAMGIEWREGDNLVVPVQEFPSNYLCWLQLQKLGVEVRRVESTNGRIEPEDLMPHVDRRTRLVSISHVQFYSGFRVDLGKIAEVCAKHHALLVVDGTQSIGAMSLSVEASGVDVLVVSGHKWMLAPRGIGFMAMSDRALEVVQPRIVGWLSVNEPFAFKRTLDLLPDARRFESGTPNGSGIYGLTERLRQIYELGPQAIHRRVLHLHEYMKQRCLQAGLEVVFDFEECSRSGILLVRKPGTPAETLHAALNAAGIYASVRSNAIRLSPHYYNTDEEMDRIVNAMSEVSSLTV